jgi:hypothetical protein
MPEDSQYPTEMTDEIREKNKHVPDEQIITDIRDTLEEIRRIRAVQGAEDIIATEHLDQQERRLAQFRADARPHQIRQRQEFVNFLKLILTDRGYNAARMEELFSVKS